MSHQGRNNSVHSLEGAGDEEVMKLHVRFADLDPRSQRALPPLARAEDRGIILLTVIWVLLILTVIAWTFARQCQMELRMTGFQTESVRAYYLARAGVARAMVYLREDKLKDQGVLGRDDLIKVDKKDENYIYDAPSEAWGYNPDAYGIKLGKRNARWGTTIENARGEFYVQVEDLSGRMNVNGTSYPSLWHLLVICGVDEKYAKPLAAAIIDYIDDDDQPTIIDDKDVSGWEFGDESREDTYYNPHQSPEEIDRFGPNVVMKNSPLSTIEELLLVPGMTNLIYQGEDENENGELDDNEDDGDESPPNDNHDGRLQLGISHFLTTQSGLGNEPIGRPNLNSAPIEVIEALLWGEEESEDHAQSVAEKIVKYRNGSDDILGSDDDKKFRTLPHSDENSEGIDKTGIEAADEQRVSQLFGVASDYFIVKSTGMINNVKKTLDVSVMRIFFEDLDVEKSKSRFDKKTEPEEQVKFLTTDFKEKG
jgi:hypothetical protein